MRDTDLVDRLRVAMEQIQGDPKAQRQFAAMRILYRDAVTQIEHMQEEIDHLQALHCLHVRGYDKLPSGDEMTVEADVVTIHCDEPAAAEEMHAWLIDCERAAYHHARYEHKGEGCPETSPAVAINRLQAIVDQLPKTADGVPIVPGLEVWIRDRWEEKDGTESTDIVECFVYQVEADRVEAADVDTGIDCQYDLPSDFYSTEAAALAAKDAS